MTAGELGSDGYRRSVLVTDAGWITVVYDGHPDFDVRNLTAEQAYALAALVGDGANEPLAELLLRAVAIVKPEVLR
jgi:hypothetical protein